MDPSGASPSIPRITWNLPKQDLVNIGGEMNNDLNVSQSSSDTTYFSPHNSELDNECIDVFSIPHIECNNKPVQSIYSNCNIINGPEQESENYSNGLHCKTNICNNGYSNRNDYINDSNNHNISIQTQSTDIIPGTYQENDYTAVPAINDDVVPMWQEDEDDVFSSFHTQWDNMIDVAIQESGSEVQGYEPNINFLLSQTAEDIFSDDCKEPEESAPLKLKLRKNSEGNDEWVSVVNETQTQFEDEVDTIGADLSHSLVISNSNIASSSATFQPTISHSFGKGGARRKVNNKTYVTRSNCRGRPQNARKRQSRAKGAKRSPNSIPRKGRGKQIGHKNPQQDVAACKQQPKVYATRPFLRSSKKLLASQSSNTSSRKNKGTLKNPKTVMRNRLTDIREEVVLSLRSLEPTLDKSHACLLLSEVQDLSSNLQAVILADNCKNSQQRELESVHQVGETLRKQLQAIIDAEEEIQDATESEESPSNEGCTALSMESEDQDDDSSCVEVDLQENAEFDHKTDSECMESEEQEYRGYCLQVGTGKNGNLTHDDNTTENAYLHKDDEFFDCNSVENLSSDGSIAESISILNTRKTHINILLDTVNNAGFDDASIGDETESMRSEPEIINLLSPLSVGVASPVSQPLINSNSHSQNVPQVCTVILNSAASNKNIKKLHISNECTGTISQKTTSYVTNIKTSSRDPRLNRALRNEHTKMILPNSKSENVKNDTSLESLPNTVSQTNLAKSPKIKKQCVIQSKPTLLNTKQPVTMITQPPCDTEGSLMMPAMEVDTNLPYQQQSNSQAQLNTNQLSHTNANKSADLSQNVSNKEISQSLISNSKKQFNSKECKVISKDQPSNNEESSIDTPQIQWAPTINAECTSPNPSQVSASDSYGVIREQYKSKGAIPKKLILNSETNSSKTIEKRRDNKKKNGTVQKASCSKEREQYLSDNKQSELVIKPSFLKSAMLKQSTNSFLLNETQSNPQEDSPAGVGKSLSQSVNWCPESQKSSEPTSTPGNTIFDIKSMMLPSESEFTTNSSAQEAFWQDWFAPWPDEWKKDYEDWDTI